MSNQTITKSDFDHIAKLSRLPVRQEEEYIADQLSQAADYAKVLGELNTDNVSPTFQVNNKKNVLREDVVKPSLSQKCALSQAPRQHNGYFVTKATISKK